MRRTVDLQPEPLWYLRGLGYADYLRTHAWRLRKTAYLEGRERRCERCGLETIDEVEVVYSVWVDPETDLECSPRKKNAMQQTSIVWESRSPRFHVHHKTYERLGHELDDDLELLCSPCHNLEHRSTSNAARWWRQHIDAGDDEALYSGEGDEWVYDELTAV